MDNREYIDKLYRKIANEGSIQNIEKSVKIAKSLGYTDRDIELGGNLGLGCGNPVQNANLVEGEVVVDLGCGRGIDVFKSALIVGEKGHVIGG